MVAEHLLKIPLSKSDEHIVVNVKQNGSAPLDLRLVATDGSDVYVSEVKQSRIPNLQSKQSPISESEWETVLSSKLLIRLQSDEKQTEVNTVEKIEIIASITETQLLLVFRRNISDITQRLGEIILRKDDDEAIELYDWAAAAADMTNNLAKEVRELDAKYQAHSHTIKKLNDQLEDLIYAKKEHETLLLGKFQALLNTKKLKIRDQQRLLAGAKIDPKKAAQVRDARLSQTSRSPEASRAAKRKPKEESPTGEGLVSASEDSGFEKQPALEPESDAEQVTPPHSDLDATEDEDEEHDLDSVAQSNSASGKGKLLEDRPDETLLPQANSPTPPPPRQLPFASDKTIASAKSQSPSRLQKDTKGDDSETTDDEL